jgi:N-acetylglucosaminyldiphosphoundecaprenol N-acetyl-beta-D-mannosaminyltransferase
VTAGHINHVDGLPTKEVIGIPLYDGTIESFFDIVQKQLLADSGKNRQISFCDANVLVSANKSKVLRETLCKHTYLNMPDGMPGVWVARSKGAQNIDRCYGPDVFEYILKNTAKDGSIKHYFSGGKAGVADELQRYCEHKYGNMNIVGTHCPPFREITEKEIKSIATEINSRGTKMLWIGISSPKQDIYARRLSRYLNVQFIFTVGAAFDFFTGQVKQAPRVIQRNGFEWLYRIFAEPRRMGKRYLMVVPYFILYNLKELFGIQKNSACK